MASFHNPPRKYDVFLSFRGEDTRNNFTGHLFSALVRHGLSTFRDNKLNKGEEIGLELLKVIEGSRVSVIVFSRKYADSRWCLDELVKILECKRVFKQIVVPVFYNVDPAEVGAQMGSFAEAFERHEERYKSCGSCGMEAKMEKWRAALTEAADLPGWNLQNVANGYESKIIEKIVEDISNKLNLPYLNIATYPVGIESRVERVNKLLNLESNDVRIVGIWGIGGIGKTTIAKAVYNLIRLKFKGSSFLADVREMSKQPNGLIGLQEQLLSDILKNENQNISNVDQGIEFIKQRLWCRRVLLVLDDVDDFCQLKALAIKRDSFPSGSRIIVTTRDKSLLNLLEADGVYTPALLSDYDSLRLFSLHAFRKDRPKEDYVELSRKVVGYSGRIPLVLEVLGCFLFDKTIPEWNGALEKLRVIPNNAIQEKLKISFDSLDDEEKDLFLDIACFFVRMDKNCTIEILKARGFFLEIELAVLSRRCLVKTHRDYMTMHDVIRDMGRDIARREHRKDLGRRSRLWLKEDVLDVLTDHMGTEAIEGLILNLPGPNDVQLNAQAFAKMTNLRLLQLNYVHLSGSYEHLPKRLIWLCWIGFPLRSIPSNLFMETLVVIDMRYSNMKKVWKGRKILSKLKILDLSHSYHLTETPDFSGVTSLERLLLNNCTRLVKVHQSIECLDKLLVLKLQNCKNLRMLPLGIWKLTSLQYLTLFGCSKLEKLPGFQGSTSKSWFSLISSQASLLRNPDSISLLPASIPGLISIKRLNLANCNLSYVPDQLGSLISLIDLDLEGNKFCTLPASINLLSRLSDLRLSQCIGLQSLPELPVNLKYLDARSCTSLERISNGNGSNFQNSPFLTFHGCNKLVENNFASNLRKSLLQNQELSTVGKFSILFPGGEVPEHFNYRTVESDFYSSVSLLPERKIRGWSLCIVLTSYKNEMVTEPEFSHLFSLFYEVMNKTKGFKKDHEALFYDRPLYGQDHIWLIYGSHHYHELQIEAGDEVEFTIRFPVIFLFDTLFQVKKWGVNFIYEDNGKDYLSNDQAMIQYASTSYQDVILDKDVSTDQAIADDKGRESATSSTSLTAIRGTLGKRKCNGANFSSHKRKNPSVLPFLNNITTEDDSSDTSDDSEKSS